MKSYNLWLGLSAEFRTELWEYIHDDVPPVQFPLLENLSQDTKDFFNAIYDEGTLDNLFPHWTSPASKDFRLLSFYANKPENASQIRSDLDAMAVTYSQDFSVLGAWKCEDGLELGTDWVYDTEDPPNIIGITGTPIYPIPSFALNFMPDVIDVPGDPGAEPPVPPTYKPPTEMTDVNVLFGQTPRQFGSWTP